MRRRTLIPTLLLALLLTSLTLVSLYRMTYKLYKMTYKSPIPDDNDKNVEVTSERHGDQIDEIARGKHCIDAVITLSAELHNMRSSVALPVTVDIKGKSEVLLAEFTPINPMQRWTYQTHYKWQIGGRLAKIPAPYLYRLPFEGDSRVIQAAHGALSHQIGTPSEEAIDFEIPVGTKVRAARAGEVVAYRNDCTGGTFDSKSFYQNNYVIIRHDDGTYAKYLYLKQDGVLVKIGERVNEGQTIALSGITGERATPHLHFAVFYVVDATKDRSIPVTFKNAQGTPFHAVEKAIYSNP